MLTVRCRIAMQLATAKASETAFTVRFLDGEEVVLPAAEWVPATADEEDAVDLKALLIKHRHGEHGAAAGEAAPRPEEFELVLLDEDEVPLPEAPAAFAGHGGAIVRDAETGCTVCSVVSAELFVRMVARDAELSGLVHWRAVDEGGAAGGSGGGAAAAVGPAAKRRRVD